MVKAKDTEKKEEENWEWENLPEIYANFKVKPT
jgi:hypothetical protein